MIIEIKSRGIISTIALKAFVERRLAFALDRYEDRVARVRVTLGDVNGPKGGQDKWCRIDIRLRGGPTVRATALQVDAYAAIDVATHRAVRCVARAFERKRARTGALRWIAHALSDRPSARATSRDTRVPFLA